MRQGCEGLAARMIITMVFAKRLREGVIHGQITSSIRIWTSPHVKVGNRYKMGEGQIEVESITPIGFPDITPELARESGFQGVIDLLKVAKHGKGDQVYLIRFHYIAPRRKRSRDAATTNPVNNAIGNANKPGKTSSSK
jgi:hypothetical protein